MADTLHAPPIAPDERDPAPLSRASEISEAGELRLTVYEDLHEAESVWRALEREADSTVFQSFEWQSAFQRHVGERLGLRPSIVLVADGAGATLALFALSVRASRFARELAWLGSELCDYNAPLLAPGFDARFDRDRFLALWNQIAGAVRSRPQLQYDLVRLTKMPECVGEQFNPMRHLAVAANPSGAYLTRLSGDWESFYTGKRSSATRRRDRTKRKRLSDLGSVQFVVPDNERAMLDTLDTLMTQKARSFARMGVPNLFAHPGRADFFRALVTEEGTRRFVHVSRLDVGATPAAVNLGLVYKQRYYHLLASYDDGEVSRFGPGAAHLRELMQYAIKRGCKLFDFTIGDEPYKREWCDSEIVLYDYIAPATWRGAVVALPVSAWQRLKRWIKQTPAVWRLVSTARAALGKLRVR